jgi:hypothetical protein
MASTYKVLGQASPADTNAAALYTVPAGGEAVISTLSITNVSGAASTYDVYVGIDGAAVADTNALAKDVAIGANTMVTLTLGVTVDAADVISIKSGNASALTFHAFGLEIS